MEIKERLEESERIGPEGAAESEPEPETEEVAESESEETEAVGEPKPEAETPAADGEPEPEVPAEPEPEQGEEPEAEAQTPVRTFTQEEVNALVGKARAEGRKRGYEQAQLEAREKYGVDDDEQLDALFADGTRYGEASSRLAESGNRLKEVQAELALVKSQILPERQADVKAILAASGLDVTEEAIASLLPTHPEWRAQAMPTPNQGATPAPAPEIPQPQTQAPIRKLGVEPAPKDNGGGEKDAAMRLFGLTKK